MDNYAVSRESTGWVVVGGEGEEEKNRKIDKIDACRLTGRAAVLVLSIWVGTVGERQRSALALFAQGPFQSLGCSQLGLRREGPGHGDMASQRASILHLLLRLAQIFHSLGGSQLELRRDDLEVVRRRRPGDGVGPHRILRRRVLHLPGAVDAGIRSPAPVAPIWRGHVRERRVEENPCRKEVS